MLAPTLKLDIDYMFQKHLFSNITDWNYNINFCLTIINSQDLIKHYVSKVVSDLNIPVLMEFLLAYDS